MKQRIQFYQCPSPDDNLSKDQVWVTALCDAGCARLITYPESAKDDVPKVCAVCAEWLINIKGYS